MGAYTSLWITAWRSELYEVVFISITVGSYRIFGLDYWTALRDVINVLDGERSCSFSIDSVSALLRNKVHSEYSEVYLLYIGNIGTVHVKSL